MTPQSREVERCIRILNGPLRGAVFPVQRRLSIGRANGSDIQVVHSGISRQHAHILREASGRHVLIDLRSSNGTFVAGSRIRRHVLEPGEVFKIMRTSFSYEYSRSGLRGGESGEFVVPRIDLHTLRATTCYEAANSLGLTPSMVTRELETASEPLAAAPDRTAVDGEQERHPVVARRPDGTAYEGNLIADIVDYRLQRCRLQEGPAQSPKERARFMALEKRLHVPLTGGAHGQGAIGRFSCKIPAALRFASGEEVPATVVTMGTDDAEIHVAQRGVALDTIVWLAFDLVLGGQEQSAVFTGRVAWTNQGHIGLSFAGTPSWQRCCTNAKTMRDGAGSVEVEGLCRVLATTG